MFQGFWSHLATVRYANKCCQEKQEKVSDGLIQVYQLKQLVFFGYSSWMEADDADSHGVGIAEAINIKFPHQKQCGIAFI